MEENRTKYEIYAYYGETTIRVYQAYNDKIANEAIRLGTFGQEFKRTRMTWIKPSFLWMMYRSDWGRREGQNRILAIDIKRVGFDYIVNHAVPSSYQPEYYESVNEWKKVLKHSEIRCQWDPERDIYGNALDYRSIQLGIKGQAVDQYVSDWIVKITDFTQKVHEIKEEINHRTFKKEMLPKEKKYEIGKNI